MKLPQHKDATLLAIDKAIEVKENAERKRAYLGMSGVGHACRRKLWYEFRWAEKSRFEASTLRLFQDGHKGEDIMAERLRMVPSVELYVVDYGTGRQFEFKDLSGHFLGHMDGSICGLVQNPTEWHVWEHKQVAETKYKKLIKLIEERGEQHAFAAWDWTYYVQGILYMHYSGMKKHYLTVSTPGGREYTSCTTEFLQPEKDEVESTIKRAKKIIEASEPPPRHSEDPNNFVCGWCDYKEICHGTKAPQANCRTCAHSTPVMSEEETKGSWVCSMHEKELSRTAQRKGCADHIFIPPVINLPMEEASEEDNYVGYKLPNGNVFYNSNHTGHRCFDSEQLSALDDLTVLQDEALMAVIKDMGGTIVPNDLTVTEKEDETNDKEVVG